MRVAIYAKVCLSPSIISLPISSPPIEFILISIIYLNIKFFAGCFYRPPDHPQDSTCLLDILSSCSLNLSNNLLLFGDFNHNILHYSPPPIQHLMDFYSLDQIIRSPTRYSQSGHSAALDLAFIPMSIASSHIILPPVSNSDHQSILISIYPKTSPHSTLKPPPTKTIRLYNKANYNAINQSLNSTDWSSFVTSDPTSSCISFHETVNNLFCALIPTKSMTSSSLPDCSPPLVNPLNQKENPPPP